MDPSDCMKKHFRLLYLFGMISGKKWNRTLLTINVILLIHILILITTEIVNIFKISNDIQAISATLAPVCFHIESIFKWTVVSLKRKKIRKIKDDIDYCIDESIEINQMDIINNLNKHKQVFGLCKKKCDIFVVAWSTVCFYGVFHWCINPMITLIICQLRAVPHVYTYHLNTSLPCTITLPLEIWTPIPSSITTLAYFCYFYMEIVAALISCLFLSTFDCFYIATLMHMCTVLQYLNDSFEKCVMTMNDEKNLMGLKRNKQYLTSCIRQHQRIIQITTDFNEIFWLIIFVQIIKTILVLCNVAFSTSIVVLESGSAGQVLSLSEYFGLVTAQFFVYCWYADSVRVKLSAISDGIYDTEWLDCDESARKSITFVIQRSQKIFYFSGGPFHVLNMETFKAMLTMSFSYFTVLRTMNE